MHPGGQPSDAQTSPRSPFPDGARLLDHLASHLSPDEAAHIEQVFAFARDMGSLDRRATPLPTTPPPTGGLSPGSGGLSVDLTHGLDLAEILAEMVHAGAVLIASALLWPLVDHGRLTLTTIRSRLRKDYGTEIARLLSRVQRFKDTGAMARIAIFPERDLESNAARPRSAAPLAPPDRVDAGPFREWLAATENDPRVLVFHLAERLQLMRMVHEVFDRHRTARQAPHQTGALPAEWSADECQTLAHDTERLYSRIAGRLGMSRLEGELGDHAFAILKPARFRWLSESLAMDRDAWNDYVARIRETIHEKLTAHGIQAEVSGRAKYLSSIHKKMQKTRTLDTSQLNDILALRIVVPTMEECYLALSHVHSIWPPLTDWIKDYIGAPKRNGYQSLHTSVTCLDNRIVEVQIRTPEMHHVAEYGMHWVYKQFGDDALYTFRDAQDHANRVVHWHDLIRQPRQTPGGHLTNVTGDAACVPSVTVTTKDGAPRTLPVGATALDFAYHIHTDIGNHCAEVHIHARADASGQPARPVPLDYPLRDGDIVEIVTRKEAHPVHAWLDDASTKRARHHILRYLRAHDNDHSLRRGRDRLNRELRLLDPPRNVDDLSDDEIQGLANACDRRNADALLVAIGSYRIPTATLHRHVIERFQPPSLDPAATHLRPGPPSPAIPGPTSMRPTPPSRPTSTSADLAGVYVQLAGCCEPLPGDAVTGYVARGGYIAIHRSACPFLSQALAGQPGRRVDLGTDYHLEAGPAGYRVTIEVLGLPRPDFQANLVAAIADHGAVMVESSFQDMPNRASLRAAVRIREPHLLAALLTGLRSVPGVLNVRRREPAPAGLAHVDST